MSDAEPRGAAVIAERPDGRADRRPGVLRRDGHARRRTCEIRAGEDDGRDRRRRAVEQRDHGRPVGGRAGGGRAERGEVAGGRRSRARAWRGSRASDSRPTRRRRAGRARAPARRCRHRCRAPRRPRWSRRCRSQPAGGSALASLAVVDRPPVACAGRSGERLDRRRSPPCSSRPRRAARRPRIDRDRDVSGRETRRRRAESSEPCQTPPGARRDVRTTVAGPAIVNAATAVPAASIPTEGSPTGTVSPGPET